MHANLDLAMLQFDSIRYTPRPLKAEHAFRRIAPIWRRNSPREKDFRLLAAALRQPRGR